MTGDYEFLSRMYGITGAQGTGINSMEINIIHIIIQDDIPACGATSPQI